MNSIYKYQPSWADGFERPTVKFSTQEELLKIPMLTDWSDESYFKRFVIFKEENLLMAELQNGETWGVGSLKTLEGISFPEWEDTRKSKS